MNRDYELLDTFVLWYGIPLDSWEWEDDEYDSRKMGRDGAGRRRRTTISITRYKTKSNRTKRACRGTDKTVGV